MNPVPLTGETEIQGGSEIIMGDWGSLLVVDAGILYKHVPIVLQAGVFFHERYTGHGQ